MLKEILKTFIPPFFLIPYQYLRKKKYNNPNYLFDGDDALFKKLVKDIKVYGEYGCGKSTNWVLENTSSKIASVDTFSEWIELVKKNNKKK